MEIIKNMSFYLKEIQEHQTEMTMDLLKLFCCKEIDLDFKELNNKYSYGNSDSRYILHSLERSNIHSIEDKKEKFVKLEKLQKDYHNQIKKMLNDFQKKNVISSKVFDNFSLSKRNFTGFLTELIIEAEGFEKRFDGLTNFFNKKYFLEEVNNRSSRIDYTIVMADIDHFKSINDTHGHHAGDFILSELADLYKTHLRKDDILGRYGGEEFIFFLHGGIASSVNVIERMRHMIEEKEFLYEGKVLKITSSFGLCENFGSHTLSTLIKKADSALYKSKKNGRNMLSIYNHN